MEADKGLRNKLVSAAFNSSDTWRIVEPLIVGRSIVARKLLSDKFDTENEYQAAMQMYEYYNEKIKLFLGL